MATWKSQFTWKCRDDNTQYHPGSFEEYRWEYNTNCDSLSIIKQSPDRFCAYSGKQIPNEVQTTYLSQDEAKSLYRCLRDWIRVYRGEKALAEADEP